MSVKAVAWVLDDLQGLKPGPSLVMLALADYADERDSCFPGQDKIAARARCSKRSVISYLKELEELGLISVERRSFSQGNGGIRRTSNRYILHLDQSYSLESAKSAPTSKTAGEDECANSALTSLESAKYPVSKVQPVALNEPPVIEPPVLSPLPPTDDLPVPPTESGAAAPRGASPVGSAGVDEPSRMVSSSAALLSSDVSEGREASSLSTGGDSTEDELVGLARDVLPVPMQAMGPSQLVKVGRAIAQRIDAGWRTDQVRQVLESRELPSQVRNLLAVVMARLRDDVPVDSPPPPGSDWLVASHRQGCESAGWSYRLSDGRVVTRRDLDSSQLTLDFWAARESGGYSGDDKWQFAIEQGVERYVLT